MSKLQFFVLPAFVSSILGTLLGFSDSSSTVQDHLYEPKSVADKLYTVGAQSLTAVTVYSPPAIDWYRGSYYVWANNVDPGITRVRFPTWTTANGQDDLEWVEGQNQGNGTWVATIQLNRHRWETGDYVTHVYGSDSTGQDTFLGYVNVQVVYGNTREEYVSAPIGYVDESNGSFDVYAYNIDGGTARVLFPTWTEANGQDDIEWVEGTNLGAGVWKATVDLKRHNSEKGIYMTHVYKYDSAGNGKMIGYLTSEVRAKTTGQFVQAVPALDFKTRSYDVYAYNVSATAAQVKFPTWSELNGQDDIEWIAGTNLGGGTWKATVSLDKHKSDLGKYYTHVYQYDSAGNASFLYGTTIQVVSNSGRVQYFYDANGRVDHIINSAGQSLFYLYDKNGNLTGKNFQK